MAGTFTFVYTDPYGATDLSVVEMIVQTQQSYCIVEAYPNQGTLSLLNGANNGATLGIAGTTLQSSQCTVNAGASSGVISGNTYTLILSLTFTSSLAGTNRVIGYAVSNDGANSGFQTLGGWNVYPRCNVTADATASVSDVQRIVNEALGAMPGVDDLNQDGLVNIADVQIVLNATLGKGCSL